MILFLGLTAILPYIPPTPSELSTADCGYIHLLSQTFSVGKRLKHQFVKVVLDTQHAHLTVYVKGRIFKRWAYPFLKH